MKHILLFENFNQANSILKKLDKTQEDEDFKKLENIVKIKGFIGLFTKLFFVDKVSLDKLEHLSLRLDKLKMILPQLKNISGKNVDEYINFKNDNISTIEKLEDDLTLLEEEHSKKKIYNELPKSWRDMLLSTTDEKRKIFNNLSKEIGNSEEYKLLFRKLSRLKSIDELIEEMQNLLNILKGGLDYESIKRKINELEENSDDKYHLPYAYIVYDNDNILVAHINNYKASALLGSKSWCISTDEYYWDDYISNENNIALLNDIYFIWDFNKNTNNDLHMIGTVREYNMFGSTHDMKDNFLNIYSLPYFQKIKNVLNSSLDSSRVREIMSDLDNENYENLDDFLKFGTPDDLKEYYFSKDIIDETLETFSIDALIIKTIKFRNKENIDFLFNICEEYKIDLNSKYIFNNSFQGQIKNFDKEIIYLVINHFNNDDECYGYILLLNEYILEDDINNFEEVLKRISYNFSDTAIIKLDLIKNYNYVLLLRKYNLEKNYLKNDESYMRSLSYTNDLQLVSYLAKNNKHKIDDYDLENALKILNIEKFQIIFEEFRNRYLNLDNIIYTYNSFYKEKAKLFEDENIPFTLKGKIPS